MVVVVADNRRLRHSLRHRTVWQIVDTMYCSLVAVEYVSDSNLDDFDADNSFDDVAANAVPVVWHYLVVASSILANRAL